MLQVRLSMQVVDRELVGAEVCGFLAGCSSLKSIGSSTEVRW